jgi:hypothetical protein
MVIKLSDISVKQVPLALQVVYGNRRYLVSALMLGGVLVVLLGWAMHVVTYVPRAGLVWDVRPLRVLEVVALASIAALVVPLEVFVVRKARRPAAADERRVGTSRSSSANVGDRAQRANLPTLLGASLGIACLICCVPLLIPAFVALAGMAGSFTLTVNTHVDLLGGAAALGGVLLGGVTMLLLAHDVLAACGVRPQQHR